MPKLITTDKHGEVLLEKTRSIKQEELTNFTKEYFSKMMKDYSEWEAISWPFLIEESRQFQLDGTIGSYMQAEIGVKYPTATDLANIILQREALMKQLRSSIVLVRQQKEAEISSATTINQINAIDIYEGWPV